MRTIGSTSVATVASFLLAGTAALAVGCSSSPGTPAAPAPVDMARTGTGGNGGSGADAGGLSKVPATVTIAVPPDFVGTPRQLYIAAFDQFPVAGPPAATLYAGNPALAAGQSLQLLADATGVSGSEYVLAIVYMQGGGTTVPQPGVDYVSQPAQVTFTGKPVDVGTLSLMRVPSPDGGQP